MSDDVLPNNPSITPQQLVSLHEAAWRWAYSLVADRSHADDVMQRTYVEIITGAARFKGQSELKTWLYGVIRNIANAHHRARERELTLVSNFAAHADWPGEYEAKDEGQEQVAEIGQALASLPLRQKEVVELVIYREFTLEQCANILGISVGSTRTHYHRAKSKLRENLKGNWHE